MGWDRGRTGSTGGNYVWVSGAEGWGSLWGGAIGVTVGRGGGGGGGGGGR